MELNIGGGVVVDLATVGDLKAMQGESAEMIKTLRPRPRAVPIYAKRVNSDVATGASLVLGIGRPATGRTWNVLALGITGADDHTAIAGSQFAIYVGDRTQPSIGQLILPGGAATIPTYQDLTEKVIWVQSSEDLYVIAYGLAASQVITGWALVADWPVEAVVAQSL